MRNFARMEYYHNPRCSKSREGLSLLQERGLQPLIREYLKESPDEQELRELLKRLKIPASELIRKKEPVYLEKYKGKELSEDEWIKAMVENPVLIERPILIVGKRAVIGRPTERILELLD